MSNFAQQLTALLPTLIRSNGVGGLTTAADLRQYEGLLIQAVGALELRVRGSRIFTDPLHGNKPDPAIGLEGDLYIERDVLDLYAYVSGQWQFLLNLLPRTSAFVPVAANAYGAHPAFLTQLDWDVWLTQHLGTGTTPVPTPAPTISGFLPISGARGSSVVLSGTNFTGATLVSINSGAVASFVVNSATQITAVLSSSQATGKVRVTANGQTAVSAGDFTVSAPVTFVAKLHMAGDSITSGAVSTSWVEYEKGLLPAANYPLAGYNNRAVSGESSNQQLARLQTEIIDQRGVLSGSFDQDIAILFVGVNDERAGDPGTPHAGLMRTKDQIAHDILEWGRLARLSGIKPILVTFTADRRQVTTDPAEDTRRVNVMIDTNNITIANAAKFGFMEVVDNTSDPLLGTPSAPLTQAGANFTNDKIHPANQGEQYIAGKIRGAIERVAALPLGTFTDPGEYVATAGNANTGQGYTPYALFSPAFGERINVTISGNSITGTGTVGGANAQFWGSATTNEKTGPTTNQIIAYVEYIANENNQESIFGWNNNNTATDFTDLLFAWHLKTQSYTNANPASGPQYGIRPFGYGDASLPNGSNTNGFIPYAAGDVLRVTIEKTRVVWYQNGVQRFVVSLTPPVGLFVDMALVPGGTVSDIRVGAANWVTRTVSTTPGVRTAVSWKADPTVTVSGNSVQKTGGTNGTFDAGTTNTVALGPTPDTVRGYLDFMAEKNGGSTLAGFHAGLDDGPGYQQMLAVGAVAIQVADTATESGIRWFVNGVGPTAYLPYAAGDRIKLEITQTQVVFYQNGTEIGRVAYVLPDVSYIDCSITNGNAFLRDVYLLATNPVTV